jgi:hypothetical protein
MSPALSNIVDGLVIHVCLANVDEMAGLIASMYSIRIFAVPSNAQVAAAAEFLRELHNSARWTSRAPGGGSRSARMESA